MIYVTVLVCVWGRSGWMWDVVKHEVMVEGWKWRVWGWAAAVSHIKQGKGRLTVSAVSLMANRWWLLQWRWEKEGWGKKPPGCAEYPYTPACAPQNRKNVFHNAALAALFILFHSKTTEDYTRTRGDQKPVMFITGTFYILQFNCQFKSLTYYWSGDTRGQTGWWWPAWDPEIKPCQPLTPHTY